MPTNPFLHNQEFDPAVIAAMSAAYTQACGALGLADRIDLFTELVAQHIIDAARHGMHTKTALYLNTVNEFRATPQ